MKIVIACDTLGKPNNGTTLAALNLISHLKERGHEVRVISPDETTRGKEGYYVVPKADLGRLLNKALLKNGVSLAKPDEGIVEKAIRGADVVHVLFPFPLAWMATRIACEHGIPVTAGFHCQAENLTAHLGLMHSRLANHAVYTVFNDRVYRHCTAIHYPTEFIRQEFLKHVDCSAIPCVISNGVSERFFNEERSIRLSDKFTVFCSGRFSSEKAQHILLKAVAMSKYRDNVKVVLAGCGPKEEKLRKLADKLGLDCEIRFFERSELPAYLRGADLYVHTAVYEIEAIACMEAIASGLVPVICSAKGSATRFFALDGKCLYRKGSVRELTERIEYFYEHPEELAKYRKLYAESAKCLELDECMRRMERMLVTAAKGRSAFAHTAEAGYPYPAEAADENGDEPASAVSY